MQAEQLRDLVMDTLQDMKAVDIRALDVRGITVLTDFMVIASGTSDRHVKSLARSV
ncbi:MAG: RsfS/YbeB/iojap family protein, partial [Gammaproteobacteria bacterium]